MRSDRARLQDILAAIDRIEQETRSGKAQFLNDAKTQIWVLYHLQTIGEASRSLSTEFRVRHDDPTWAKAIGLRNILVHHYFEIDADIIWEIVERDLPPFRALVEACLTAF